jgi:hypothetical protein
MFRTACIFVALALCAAVAPPKISLELAQGASNIGDYPAQLEKGARAHLHSNTAATTKTTLDYDESCEIGSAGTACQFPTAHAFDHVKGNVEVTTTLYLLNIEGSDRTPVKDIFAACAGSCSNVADLPKPTVVGGNGPARNYRSQYVFEYDANDGEGNHAETVTYILSLVDSTAPEVVQNCKADITVELGNHKVTSGCGDKSDKCIKKQSAVFPQNIEAETRLIGNDFSAFGWTQKTQGKEYQMWNNKKVSFDSLCADYNTDDSKNVARFTFQGGMYVKDGLLSSKKRRTITYVDTHAPVADIPTTTTYECDTTFSKFLADSQYKAQTPIFKDDQQTRFEVSVTLNGETIIEWDQFKGHTTYEKQSAACCTGARCGPGRCTDTQDFTSTYVATDKTGNSKTVVRTVSVTDTTKPVITYTDKEKMINNIQVVIRSDSNLHDTPVTKPMPNGKNGKTVKRNHKSYNDNDDVNSDSMTGVKVGSTWEDIEFRTRDLMHATYSDTCARDITVGTWQWYRCGTHDAASCKDADLSTLAKVTAANKPIDHQDYAHGDLYVMALQIDDKNGNTKTETQVITLVDEESPIITVQNCTNGAQSNVEDGHVCVTNVWASTGNADSRFIDFPSTYRDAGAKCSDFVDGPLSHAVEVSGDIVSLDQATVTTYTIKYNCQDLSGLDAPLAERIVRISDKTNPIIEITDKADFQIEAGYPYVDPGALMYDDMAGTTNLDVTVEYKQLSGPGAPRDGGSCSYTAKAATAGKWASPASASKCTIDTKCTCTTPNCRCKWQVKYSATDSAGNKAKPQYRKVTVADTLAPVIVLTHTNGLFAHDDSTTIEHRNSKDRKEHDRFPLALTKQMEDSNNKRANAKVLDTIKIQSSNLQMMAETTSVNGWFIGAVACAVTGVALLSLATRKTSVTEVPV